MPLPMNSATHMNTLPVRADLFGRKMNATITEQSQHISLIVMKPGIDIVFYD